MSGYTFMVTLLLMGTLTNAQMDWSMLYKQPQLATGLAKDYVVGALSKPLANLRNTVCATAHMDEAAMRSHLDRAADTVVNAITETSSVAPEQMQQALNYVSTVAKQVLSDPNFKPQLDSLQQQLTKTVGYLGDRFGNQMQENMNQMQDNLEKVKNVAFKP